MVDIAESYVMGASVQFYIVAKNRTLQAFYCPQIDSY